MEAAVLRLSGSPTSIFLALPPSTASLCSNLTVLLCPTSLKKTKLPPAPAVCRSKNIEEQDLSGLPKEYYGDFKEDAYITVLDAYALIGDVAGLDEKIQSFFMQEVISGTHSVLKTVVKEDLDNNNMQSSREELRRANKEQIGREGYKEMGKNGGLSSTEKSGEERAVEEGIPIDESQ